MAKLEIQISTEGGPQAKRLLQDLVRSTAEMEKGNLKARQGTKAMGGLLKNAKVQALAVAGALGMGVGVAGAMVKVVGYTREWYDGLKRIAKQMRENMGTMTAFAMQQEGGQSRERAISAMQLGAYFGIPGGPATNAVQAFQAQRGGFRPGLLAAAEAFRLSGWGAVPLQEAQAAVSAGIALKYSPGYAARLPYAAGEASALSAAQLVRVAPAMSFYRGFQGGGAEAYGVAAALSGTITAEKLETFTRSLAVGLGTREGKWGQYVGTLPGAAKGDIWQMLGGMKAQGISTTQDLERLGLREIRQQASIVNLLADLDAAKRKAARVRTLAAQEGLISVKRAGAEIGFGELRFERLTKRMGQETQAEMALATTELGEITSLAAQRYDIRRLARGRAMTEWGWGPVLDAGESGADWFEWMRARGYQAMAGPQSPYRLMGRPSGMVLRARELEAAGLAELEGGAGMAEPNAINPLEDPAGIGKAVQDGMSRALENERPNANFAPRRDWEVGGP